MVTVEQFADYVGEVYAESDRQADLELSLLVGSAAIDRALGSAWREPSEAERDQMVKDYALAVYQRSSNNNGQYDNEAPAGPLDPMTRVRPMLRQFVMGL